jgi:hypothetical protein
LELEPELLEQELGAWSCQSLELGTVPGVGAGPTRYRGKPFSFLFFFAMQRPFFFNFLFVALQRSKPSSSFCFSLRCSAASILHFFLLRCVAALKRSQPSSFFFAALRCNAAAQPAFFFSFFFAHEHSSCFFFCCAVEQGASFFFCCAAPQQAFFFFLFFATL